MARHGVKVSGGHRQPPDRARCEERPGWPPARARTLGPRGQRGLGLFPCSGGWRWWTPVAGIMCWEDGLREVAIVYYQSEADLGHLDLIHTSQVSFHVVRFVLGGCREILNSGMVTLLSIHLFRCALF